ncbi:ABC transporter permease, partial [Mycobacterium tuberculosis]|nr:ABC transporter permease [Mycobacterium tuberculosis]
MTMDDHQWVLSAAWQLVASHDPAFFGIILLSLKVTLTAVAAAGLVGLPLGAALALGRFPGRAAVIVVVNAFMGLPPVVAGLDVFVLLSRSGPLGDFGLLFTPQAMMVAQFV